MKTSITTAAIRCATAGRNAGRFGKYVMSTLLRKSYLSMLHLPGLRSIAASHPVTRTSPFTGKAGKPEVKVTESRRLVMRLRDRWQQDGDTRLAVFITTVMRSQENPATKALALS